METNYDFCLKKARLISKNSVNSTLLQCAVHPRLQLYAFFNLVPYIYFTKCKLKLCKLSDKMCCKEIFLFVWWQDATLFVYFYCLVLTLIKSYSVIQSPSAIRLWAPGVPSRELNSVLPYRQQADAITTEQYAAHSQLRCTLLSYAVPFLTYAAPC
jgi:hypothetical protein